MDLKEDIAVVTLEVNRCKTLFWRLFLVVLRKTIVSSVNAIYSLEIVLKYLRLILLLVYLYILTVEFFL